MCVCIITITVECTDIYVVLTSILQLLGNGLSLFRQNIIVLTNEVEANGQTNNTLFPTCTRTYKHTEEEKNIQKFVLPWHALVKHPNGMRSNVYSWCAGMRVAINLGVFGDAKSMCNVVGREEHFQLVADGCVAFHCEFAYFSLAPWCRRVAPLNSPPHCSVLFALFRSTLLCFTLLSIAIKLRIASKVQL